jgi:hypothetical protein
MTARRALHAALLSALLATQAHADFIETTWTVTNFSGEAWFIDADSLEGATQYFEAGYAEGAFYACDFAGQSMAYTTYAPDDFLANPEFADFAMLDDPRFTLASEFFVHRITCEGQGDPAARRILYPFVTTDGRDAAFLPFEGGIFTLEPAE